MSTTEELTKYAKVAAVITSGQALEGFADDIDMDQGEAADTGLLMEDTYGVRAQVRCVQIYRKDMVFFGSLAALDQVEQHPPLGRLTSLFTEPSGVFFCNTFYQNQPESGSSFSIIFEGGGHVESPFDEVDRARSDQFTLLLHEIRNSPHILHRERVADRLESLKDAAEEETADRFPVLPESVASLMSFFAAAPETIRYPQLSLAPTGNILAQWRTDAQHNFTVEFLSFGHTRFIVFAPDEHRPSEIVRFTGSGTTEFALGMLTRSGISSWTLDEG